MGQGSQQRGRAGRWERLRSKLTEEPSFWRKGDARTGCHVASRTRGKPRVPVGRSSRGVRPGCGLLGEGGDTYTHLAFLLLLDRKF